MITTENFPTVSPLLVDRLAELYPDKAPDPRDTDRDIWIAVGRVEVVKKLRQLSEEQHTTVLAST
jgi:hypothetical protein